MGTGFQIAGSSSQVLIDAATLQQFAEDADHCIAMAGQVGSQVKMRVGSSWLVANVRALVLDRQAEGLIVADIDFLGAGSSEETKSELPALMRIPYVVFFLTQKHEAYLYVINHV